MTFEIAAFGVPIAADIQRSGRFYISRINQRIIRAEAAPPSSMGGSGILDVKNKAMGSRIHAVYRTVA